MYAMKKFELGPNMTTPTTNGAHKAASVLRNGGVVLHPTDTIYGLGCDPTNTDAVQKVHRIKGSNPQKPLLVLAGNMDMVREYAYVPKVMEDILPLFIDKPLTILLKTVSDALKPVGCCNAVAFRIPQNIFCREMVEDFGKPVASTSANRTNHPYVTDIHTIYDVLPLEDIELVVNAGTYSNGTHSTIIDVQNGVIEILRQGSVTSKELATFCVS